MRTSFTTTSSKRRRFSQPCSDSSTYTDGAIQASLGSLLAEAAARFALTARRGELVEAHGIGLTELDEFRQALKEMSVLPPPAFRLTCQPCLSPQTSPRVSLLPMTHSRLP
jgi:hypothetical protein